jgi:hypothetical protein
MFETLEGRSLMSASIGPVYTVPLDALEPSSAVGEDVCSADSSRVALVDPTMVTTATASTEPEAEDAVASPEVCTGMIKDAVTGVLDSALDAAQRLFT